MSKKSSKPSEEEIALFRKATSDVRRLKPSDRHTFLPPKPKATRRRETELDEFIADQLSDGYLADGDSDDPYLEFSRPGVQKKLLRKFRQGKLGCEAELDLHGFTSDQARRELVQFLERCQFLGMRCVRVIHGKGYGSQDGHGVLKSKVNNWLRQYPEVIAFNSAQAADGGTGAVYVLLRRAKD